MHVGIGGKPPKFNLVVGGRVLVKGSMGWGDGRAAADEEPASYAEKASNIADEGGH